MQRTTTNTIVRPFLLLVLALTLIAVTACGSAADVGEAAQRSTTTERPTTGCADNPACAAAAENPAPSTTTTAEDPEVTNARRSAEQYLDLGGFSRQGLIDQLSSEYGDQYPVDVATAAVDSLDVNYNAEAVEAAESYLEFQSFSHAGLVDQLSSEYGDQFTPEQAEHGATEALG